MGKKSAKDKKSCYKHEFKLRSKDTRYGTDGQPVRDILTFVCIYCGATDVDDVPRRR